MNSAPDPEFPENREPASVAPVTMADIARAVGVTKAAVSMALNNSPRISPARRRQIQETADRMGYSRNAMATALAHSRRQQGARPVQAGMAWLNTWPEPEKLRTFREFDLYWRGASKAAEKFGFRLEEFRVSPAMPLRRLENVLLARGIRGIIIAPVLPAPKIDWAALDWQKFSVVRLGRRSEPPEVHFVTSAQAANAMFAFDRIRERGYQRVGFAGHWARQRMFGAGFLWAQQEFPGPLSLPPCLIDEEAGLKAQKPFETWLRKVKPDAILTDHVLVPAMLKRAGCRVPEDIGLAATSIHDTPIDAGIDQNSEEIGRAAVLLAISLIHDNALGVPGIVREILVRGRWVDGTSLPRRE